jgi:hypothetical protein
MEPKLKEVTLLKQLSAWLPLVMSFVALGLVLGHWAVFGNTHDPDEGAAAHIFQILMAVQLPLVVFFIIKWLPRQRKQALLVLALLAILWIAAWAAVYFLT